MVQSVCSINILLKIDYFKRTLIQKNVKNKKVLKNVFERKKLISK